ncbi:enoyl-CoA hydratase-related protein [Cumulibacter manganitolerans]|uniref:enoyl-CoA hydratase-related protein n=1 Tax=Cumulibacter manganitolerans TaxID=1884992 RepID=UPI001295F0B8|nr:enoyl-CoA hydratase-related protein [Cumulibacter manganitolerans]
MTEQVRYELDDAVAVVTIDRPERKNAMNPAVSAGLADAFARARRDGARAVVVTGAGGAFCAGADITGFEGLRESPVMESAQSDTLSMWQSLAALRIPVIAAVEGLALGGGCELALACDIVVAARDAKIGVPEVKLGVIPGAGGTQRLITAVGKAKAMRMLLTGEPISGEDAERAGLVSDLAESGGALEAAKRIAATIAGNSPLAVGLAKDAALASVDVPLATGLEYERRNFKIALASDDCHEGQAAFLEKRRPEFTGK